MKSRNTSSPLAKMGVLRDRCKPVLLVPEKQRRGLCTRWVKALQTYWHPSAHCRVLWDVLLSQSGKARARQLAVPAAVEQPPFLDLAVQ